MMVKIDKVEKEKWAETQIEKSQSSENLIKWRGWVESEESFSFHLRDVQDVTKNSKYSAW